MVVLSLDLTRFADSQLMKKKKFLVILVLIQTISCKNEPLTISLALPHQPIDKIDRRIFLDLSTKFKNQLYNHPYNPPLTIPIGLLQTEIILKVTKKIFSKVYLEKPSNQFKTTLTPKLIKFEISRPEETGLNYYECRIQYMVLMQNLDDIKNSSFSVYTRIAKPSGYQRSVLSKLISSCTRKVASKLEISILSYYGRK
ncbi:MAG: hypothetical protein VX086_02150 [Pseudomonadota bacterium]|nr:hypothetical protein [Pseudomonadota bacterium]